MYKEPIFIYLQDYVIEDFSTKFYNYETWEVTTVYNDDIVRELNGIISRNIVSKPTLEKLEKLKKDLDDHLLKLRTTYYWG
jgi:hypothetical protein